MSMEQQVKVEVEPAAANDQWPKLRPYGLNDCPVGTMYYVTEGDGSVTAWQNAVLCGIKIGEKEVNGIFFDGRLCFNDLDEFCRWWLNPQPVNEEPEMVPIKSLKAGNFFVAGDEIFLRSNCQHNPSVINAGSSMAFPDNHLVTPFKGRITIDVE